MTYADGVLTGLVIALCVLCGVGIGTLALPYARRWLGGALTAVTLGWIERKKDRIQFELWRSTPEPFRREEYIMHLRRTLGSLLWLDSLEDDQWQMLLEVMKPYTSVYAKRLMEQSVGELEKEAQP